MSDEATAVFPSRCPSLVFKLLADCSTVAEGTLSQQAQAPADDANTGPATSLSVLLVTYPYPGHLIPTATLGEELVRRGHNVSLCTTILHMDAWCTQHGVKSG